MKNLQLPQPLRDEPLEHRVRTVGLRARVGDPLVLAAFEHFVPDEAAGCAIRRGEFFLERRQHVVVERALHDQEHEDLVRAVGFDLRSESAADRCAVRREPGPSPDEHAARERS